MHTNSTFAIDVQFLTFIMKHEQDMAIDKLLAIHNNGEAITSEVITTLNSEVVISIMSALSSTYKEILYRYFAEKALIEFITKKSFMEFKKVSVALNTKLISNKKQSEPEIYSKEKDIPND